MVRMAMQAFRKETDRIRFYLLLLQAGQDLKGQGLAALDPAVLQAIEMMADIYKPDSLW